MTHTSHQSKHLFGSEKFALFPLEWIPHFSTPAMQTVFLVLCAYADCEGRSFPAIPTIARWAHVHERSVLRAIRDLEKIGAIRISRATGKSSKYEIAPPPQTPDKHVTPDTGVTPDAAVTPPLTPVSPHPRHRCQGTPDTGVTLSNHVTNQVNQPPEENALRARTRESEQADELLEEYARQKNARNAPQSPRNDPSRTEIRPTANEALSAAQLPQKREAAESPALDFAAWFVRAGVDEGGIPPDRGLDIRGAAYRESTEAANALLGAYGRAECEVRAHRLFAARKARRIRRAATIATLRDCWEWSEIEGLPERAEKATPAKKSTLKERNPEYWAGIEIRAREIEEFNRRLREEEISDADQPQGLDAIVESAV